MLTSTKSLLQTAEDGGYAIGAFNIYNLEGAMAVVAAAEGRGCPAILQIHSASLEFGGDPLIALCLAAAESASAPMAVHLDHSADRPEIDRVLAGGVNSIMADGSSLDYEDNVTFTRGIAELVHSHDGVVEAELGRLSGTEDTTVVAEYDAKLTDPEQAAEFVERTGVDSLAVCIGNVHGRYRGWPTLDFGRLEAIRDAVSVPLVLHGASGLPENMIQKSIELGVRKFNVNTEVRSAYMESLSGELEGFNQPELLELMDSAVNAMKEVAAEKLRLFGFSGTE